MYIHFYMVQIAIFPSRDFTWAQPVPRSSAARLDGGRVERFSMSTHPSPPIQVVTVKLGQQGLSIASWPSTRDWSPESTANP